MQQKSRLGDKRSTMMTLLRCLYFLHSVCFQCMKSCSLCRKISNIQTAEYGSEVEVMMQHRRLIPGVMLFLLRHRWNSKGNFRLFITFEIQEVVKQTHPKNMHFTRTFSPFYQHFFCFLC